ncbi:MAG TPA: hypothetical protein VGJ84_06570, partial [Polyangiaceae bacterium]
MGRARRGARQRQHQHQEREQWLRQKQLQRQRKQRLQQQPRQQRRQWLGCFSEWGALARPRTFRATGVETRQITDAGV